MVRYGLKRFAQYLRGGCLLAAFHFLTLLLCSFSSFAADSSSYVEVRYDAVLGRVQYTIQSDEAKSMLLNGYCHELNGVGQGKIIDDNLGWETQLIPYTIFSNSQCSNSADAKIIDKGNLACPAAMDKECKRNSDFGAASGTALAPSTKCNNKDPSWLVGEQACRCGENQQPTPLNQECPAPVLPDGEICDSAKSSWVSLSAACYCGEKSGLVSSRLCAICCKRL